MTTKNIIYDVCICMYVCTACINVYFTFVHVYLFVMLEFLDKTDRSLAFAIFGAAQYNVYPVAVFPVSSGHRSTDELLLCFDGLLIHF